MLAAGSCSSTAKAAELLFQILWTRLKTFRYEVSSAIGKYLFFYLLTFKYLDMWRRTCKDGKLEPHHLLRSKCELPRRCWSPLDWGKTLMLLSCSRLEPNPPNHLQSITVASHDVVHIHILKLHSLANLGTQNTEKRTHLQISEHKTQNTEKNSLANLGTQNTEKRTHLQI